MYVLKIPEAYDTCMTRYVSPRVTNNNPYYMGIILKKISYSMIKRERVKEGGREREKHSQQSQHHCPLRFCPATRHGYLLAHHTQRGLQM